MRYLLTGEQARAAEARAVATGVALSELMDRAGSSVAAEVTALVPRGRVVVAAGAGNNGGDGWVAARRLHEAGRDVIVLTAAAADQLPSPAREAVRDAVEAGVPWRNVDGGAQAAGTLEGASVVVDALLGIGLHGAPRQPFADLIRAINHVGVPVVAVDVPSGVDSDTGEAPGAAVNAGVTVTFSAPKVGCILYPGASFTGELVVADIGLDPAFLRSEGAPESWDVVDYARHLPRPHWNDRKGTRGRVLVVGGSLGLTGAVCLAAGGALRSGAGFVTVAVPRSSLSVVETKLTAPVKLGLPADGAGAMSLEAVGVVLEAASRADAVVLGPGLGRAAQTGEAIRALVERLDIPLLIDADALYALGDDLGAVAGRTAPTVLTPHAAEAARLLGATPEKVDADRLAAVRALAVGRATAVLKGPATLIAGGGRIVVNPTGGPGLATLGTGDVLSGIVGALLARGMLALDAAVLGAYLHGAAGDSAALGLTALCCTAEDVAAHLPSAVRPLMNVLDTGNRWRDA
jgi:ADP-dependent NAD(P)H-hydrate dehydratase / NAD(P)H-hydrate epimerase